MKTNFTGDWNTLKKAYDAAAQVYQNDDETVGKFLKVLQQPTGLTPILKEVDAAFAKEHRKAVNEALLKFYAKREPVAKVLAKFIPKVADDDRFQMAVMDYMQGIQTIEKEIQKKLKTLQDDKAGAAGASDWNLLLLFETDLQKNIDTLTRDLKPAPLAKIEKTHEVLKLTKIPVKHMDAYSKAAARLKAPEALAALEDFVKTAEACAKSCEAIVKKEGDKAYGKAVTRFVDDLRTMVAQRVTSQLKKLQEHAKAG